MTFFLFEMMQRIAIWEAAIGEPDRLAALLRSDEPIGKIFRDELALFVEGKLVATTDVVGKPERNEPWAITIADFFFSPRGFAYSAYHAEAERLRASGKFYGKSAALKEEIAKKYGVAEETLRNDLARKPPYPKLKPPVAGDGADFRRWLQVRKNPMRFGRYEKFGR